MSKHHKETVTCPMCGKEGELLVWDSINTVFDPEMKEKVRNGEAFKWTCPHCGNTASVNYTTLYHQMEDHVMIYLVQGDKTQAIQLMTGEFTDAEGKPIDSDLRLGEDYRKRVVDSVNALREKLMILDAGLDDHVVELMKVFLIGYLTQKEKNLQIEDFLFEIKPDGTPAFAVNTGEANWGSVVFLEDSYNYIAEKFKKTIESDHEVVIDQKWALDLLSKQD